MATDAVTDSKNLIEGFIREHVTGQGLDRRTEKAYRLDLEHFYIWLDQTDNRYRGAEGPKTDGWERCTKAYLDYLRVERKLSYSTICRKDRVLSYYLSYLSGKGVISGYRPPLKYVRGKRVPRKKKESGLLSRKDADALFAAMNREYENLDSEFRRRICLRDMVMMELLFCHKIEISELLRMRAGDYDSKTGNLLIRRKREEESGIYLYSKELRRKMGLWLEEREHFCREGQYRDIMFLSKLGRPLSMEMVVKIFDKYRLLAGIEKEFTPRDLKEGVMKAYARELVMERWG
ncbi:MAG: tyrosine-type recombinase/integrase [Hungatella sp.]|nr:tyrosine-type recombinase/integrase [Hungatella sp.]